jgi:hypothetical protein
MARKRAHSFLRERTQRAVVTRRVFPYLALVTLSLAVLAGFVVTLIEKQDFPTFGDGSGGRSSRSAPSATATSFRALAGAVSSAAS